MNILPKKNWHVRTKKNIARVRKDEAEAAAKEKETQRRIHLAAEEARTAFLRIRANQRVQESGADFAIPLTDIADVTQGDGHINFFQDLQQGKKLDSEINKEHEEEKKKEQEDYEKKIGCLVYLGQNSLGDAKDRLWYETHSVAHPKQKDFVSTSTTDLSELKITKLKDFEDPLKEIRKSLATPGIKKLMREGSTSSSHLKRKADSVSSSSQPQKHHKKKHSSHKSKKKKSKKKKSRKSISSSYSESETDSETEKKKKLEMLRAERLERERDEQRKADNLLRKLRGESPSTAADESTPHPQNNRQSSTHPSRMRQKYNSQFNPQLARQNYDD